MFHLPSYLVSIVKLGRFFPNKIMQVDYRVIQKRILCFPRDSFPNLHLDLD